jgi:lipoprotein NlpD
MTRALLVALLLGTGCARTLVDYETAYYTVRAGDTLTGIAARYGVEPGVLADWNGIRNPNLIRPGQRLVLRPGLGRPAAAPSRSSAGRAASARSPPRVDAPMPRWQWPTRGRVVSAFGAADNLPTGIGIGGVEGQPVSAAAAGRVVYAGSGLIGYGQLIIIKHNETYLTAYGLNRRLLVRQGDDVSGGQTIAEMGVGPNRMARLHFEIRRNGEPVDPLGLMRAGG